MVEILSKGLEIDVGRVHHCEEFLRRFWVDIASGHRHITDALLAAGQCGVDRVFGKDHRVVVGVGDSVGAMLVRRVGDGLRAGRIHQAIHVLRLGNVPVLAELAGQVTASGAEGQDAAARIKMVERLFLDRIDAKAGRAAIGGQLHGAIDHLADETGAALAFVQLAVARAKVALHTAIGQGVPPASGVQGCCGQHDFSCHF